MSENRIEAIKARREEYEDVRYQNYSGDLTKDASVDFDYLLAEVARLQAECAALKAENQRWRFRSYPNNPELPG